MPAHADLYEADGLHEATLAAVAFRHKVVRDLWWVLSSPHLLSDDADLPLLSDCNQVTDIGVLAPPVACS